MNRKGYVLVEIILASVIAFGIAYFIIDLTIKLKNKNDDLMVETLVETDRSIISNKLMGYLYLENEDFNCENISVNNKKVIYEDKDGNSNTVDIINDYVTVDNIICNKNDNNVYINIPLSVKQMPDRNFDIELYYRFMDNRTG